MATLAAGDNVELLKPNARSDLRVTLGVRDGGAVDSLRVTVGACDDDGRAAAGWDAGADGTTVGAADAGRGAGDPGRLLPLDEPPAGRSEERQQDQDERDEQPAPAAMGGRADRLGAPARAQRPARTPDGPPRDRPGGGS